jgi:hypothetical protein
MHSRGSTCRGRKLGLRARETGGKNVARSQEKVALLKYKNKITLLGRRQVVIGVSGGVFPF